MSQLPASMLRRLLPTSPSPRRALGPVLLLLAALLPGCTGGAGAPAPGSPATAPTPPDGAVTTVYVVRHAEKEAGEDPDLTERGRRRADALAEMLGDDDVAAVFATQYRRTRQTVAPLAAALGVQVEITEASDPAGLAHRIIDDYPGAAVVVAGHSNTVPVLLDALGVEEEIVIEDGEYGDLFVVVVTDGRVSDFTRHRFGD